MKVYYCIAYFQTKAGNLFLMQRACQFCWMSWDGQSMSLVKGAEAFEMLQLDFF
jgi:hypothetical protein